MSTKTSTFQSVNSKLLFLGDYYKYQTFSPPLHLGVKHTTEHIHLKAYRTGRTKARSASQKRTRLFNISLCNLKYATDSRVKFLTLTVAEPQFELARLSRMFTKFIMRLEYKLGFKVKYIGLPERHDSSATSSSRRGSYHIHVIFFNLPYLSMDDYRHLWPHGFLYVKAISVEASYRGLSYVLKYISEDQLLNARVYMPRHMERPRSAYNVLKLSLTPIFEHETIIIDTLVPTTIRTSLYKIT